MRIWDVNPGYLNDQSLLGEHRELHGIVSIIRNNKKGYSRHPETLRWVGFGWALRQRHRLLRAEMALRGFRDRTPVSLRANRDNWPAVFIDLPDAQFGLLKGKYRNKASGRIRLPRNTQELWAQHKYSILARDPTHYTRLGKMVASTRRNEKFTELAAELTGLLRQRPTAGRLHNALQHMWGYVAAYSQIPPAGINSLNARRLLGEIQGLSREHRVSYLMSSTALSELAAWLD